MKGFKSILRELKSNIGYLRFLESFLNTIIIFLVTYLVLYLLNVRPILALFPAVVYAISRWYLRRKESKLAVIEAKYKDLDEKLRTADDNIGKTNEIIEALQEEISIGVRRVEAGAFFNKRKTSAKMVAAVAACLLILVISQMNFVLVDLTKVAVKGFEALEDKIIEKQAPERKSDDVVMTGGPQGTGEALSDPSIYGAQSIAKLGDKQTEVKIKPISYEINVRDAQDVEQKNFQDVFPTEIFTVSSETYEENIPIEQEELVRKYFEKLAGQSSS